MLTGQHHTVSIVCITDKVHVVMIALTLSQSITQKLKRVNTDCRRSNLLPKVWHTD